MSYAYQLPAGFELTPIPTEAKQKAECKRLCDLLNTHKDAIDRIDGLVGYGIGVAVDNWCKVRIKLKFSYKLNDLQMYDGAKAIAELPGMSYNLVEGKRESKPGGSSYSGERIQHER